MARLMIAAELAERRLVELKQNFAELFGFKIAGREGRKIKSLSRASPFSGSPPLQTQRSCRLRRRATDCWFKRLRGCKRTFSPFHRGVVTTYALQVGAAGDGDYRDHSFSAFWAARLIHEILPIFTLTSNWNSCSSPGGCRSHHARRGHQHELLPHARHPRRKVRHFSLGASHRLTSNTSNCG
jgi:hypothetical protein